MNPERFDSIENRSEVGIERVENVKHEVRNALVMTSCVDMDGFQKCMNDWLDENNDLFEASFDRLLKLRPNFIEEWESSEPEIRAEIMDILNGPIVGREVEMDVAA